MAVAAITQRATVPNLQTVPAGSTVRYAFPGGFPHRVGFFGPPAFIPNSTVFALAPPGLAASPDDILHTFVAGEKFHSLFLTPANVTNDRIIYLRNATPAVVARWQNPDGGTNLSGGRASAYYKINGSEIAIDGGGCVPGAGATLTYTALTSNAAGVGLLTTEKPANVKWQKNASLTDPRVDGIALLPQPPTGQTDVLVADGLHLYLDPLRVGQVAPRDGSPHGREWEIELTNGSSQDIECLLVVDYAASA